MAVVQGQITTHPGALNPCQASCSPALPEFDTDLSSLHDIKYLTALEKDHSRELYLQGAMAVGQIARLLEELCADEDHFEEDAEDIIEDLPFVPSEDQYDALYTGYDARESIDAWAHAVDLAQNREDMPFPFDLECSAQDDTKDANLRGTLVVGDVCETLEQENDQPRQPGKYNVTIESTHESPHIDMAARISALTARLNNLETEIGEFSKDRCDALTRLELEMAAENEYFGTRIQDGGSLGHESSLEALGFRLPPVEDSHLPSRIARVWTSTATGSSGFSLDTPDESEVQLLELEPLKPEGYFWDNE